MLISRTTLLAVLPSIFRWRAVLELEGLAMTAFPLSSVRISPGYLRGRVASETRERATSSVASRAGAQSGFGFGV
jgi:hypothetical protein